MSFIQCVHDYVSRMTPTDRRILTGQPQASTSACVRAYVSAIRPMSQEEDAIVQSCIAEADLAIQRSPFIQFSQAPWNVKKISYEFPHTMHDCIMLTPGFFSSKQNAYSRVTTMVHEKIHVWQKMFPERATSFVEDVMGYRKVGQLTQQMRDSYIVRANPDVDDTLYSNLPDGAFALEVFDSPMATSIGDSHVFMVGGDGSVQQEYEHPFEEMAYVLSRLIIVASKTLL
jgi:hypothetical protein